MTDNEKNNKVSWNTSQSLVIEIGNLRSRANTYYINKDIPSALRCLSAMKMCVIHSLNDTETKELESIEKEINVLNRLKDYYVKGFAIKKDFYITLAKLDDLYIKFNNQLQKTLEKYGYLIDKKEDKTKLIA